MNTDSGKPSRLLAWLQLLRLPNVFTAMADVAMGFLFTHETLQPFGEFTLLILVSSCLYTAGMVLNDWHDVAVDTIERPQRPLPSGRIARRTAGFVGAGFVFAGFIAGGLASSLSHDQRPINVSFALLVLMLSYDLVLKSSPIGPVIMGSCRLLNVLLGMSTMPGPWTRDNFAVAAGIGLYILGVTWFARKEVMASSRVQLFGSLACMFAGMLTLWWVVPRVQVELPPLLMQLKPHLWTVFWLAVAPLISWRFIRAIIYPQPAHVQAAVKAGILGIIVLDAAVVFGIRGCLPTIGILCLLVPAILLGRWVYST
ncbi:MAG TPA: UbiA family prenyltransferase [Pirellulales bacterium]|jgi:4-hydroxybenzoate polyprenyltransferase|nr:UbiA family prenyltransferase [Pirellulales bacterium]